MMLEDRSPPPVTVADFSDVDAARPAASIAYLDAAARAGASDKRSSYAAQGLRAGMAVLDVGCGTGDDVRAIAEIVGARGRACGVDSSRAMIAEARARGIPPNGEFAVAPAGALPFPDASFDAVRAERVFVHIADAQPAAAELRRVLRSGGTAFLFDPEWEALTVAGGDPALTRRIVASLAAGMANAWAGRNARGMLRRAGFAEVRSTPLVANLPLTIAHDLILSPAIDRALAAGAIGAQEAKAWLLSLLEADRRGEFFCASLNVATLGCVP